MKQLLDVAVYTDRASDENLWKNHANIPWKTCEKLDKNQSKYGNQISKMASRNPEHEIIYLSISSLDWGGEGGGGVRNPYLWYAFQADYARIFQQFNLPYLYIFNKC